jgi:multidrug efflux pump subunit AcrA (membrane-fusion protein)
VTFLREADGAAPAAAQAARLVPQAAVRSDDASSFVFVVTGPAGDTVERRAVKVGGADGDHGDRVEVVGALHAGDRVVLSPPPALASGAKVAVR